MELWEKILSAYPELTQEVFYPNGSIELQDNADGFGAYIAKWEYSKPIPEGLHLGKSA